MQCINYTPLPSRPHPFHICPLVSGCRWCCFACEENGRRTANRGLKTDAETKKKCTRIKFALKPPLPPPTPQSHKAGGELPAATRMTVGSGPVSSKDGRLTKEETTSTHSHTHTHTHICGKKMSYKCVEKMVTCTCFRA